MTIDEALELRNEIEQSEFFDGRIVRCKLQATRRHNWCVIALVNDAGPFVFERQADFQRLCHHEQLHRTLSNRHNQATG